ncbi:hypothetical protein F5146DRAFT_934993, partial [Armillaria mellea]
RCCNADYVTASALNPVIVDKVFFSYNIACKWFPGFWERVNQLPGHLQGLRGIKMECGILKLHCWVHKLTCQCQFSMNIQPGMEL